MPPKQAAMTTTPKASSSQGDTSMGEASVDSQVVTIAQLKSIISQIEGNTEALDKRLSKIGTLKIKLLSVCLRSTYIPSPLRSPLWLYPQGFVTHLLPQLR